MDYWPDGAKGSPCHSRDNKSPCVLWLRSTALPENFPGRCIYIASPCGHSSSSFFWVQGIPWLHPLPLPLLLPPRHLFRRPQAHRPQRSRVNHRRRLRLPLHHHLPFHRTRPPFRLTARQARLRLAMGAHLRSYQVPSARLRVVPAPLPNRHHLLSPSVHTPSYRSHRHLRSLQSLAYIPWHRQKTPHLLIIPH